MFWAEVEGWPSRSGSIITVVHGVDARAVGGFDQLQGRDGAVKRFTLTSVGLDRTVYPRAHTCLQPHRLAAVYGPDGSFRRRRHADGQAGAVDWLCG